MPLIRRLPKRGFTNVFREPCRIVNITDIVRVFKAGETVDEASIMSRGLVKDKSGPIKLLGNGEITFALTVKVNRYSTSAAEKIRAAGGAAEVI